MTPSRAGRALAYALCAAAWVAPAARASEADALAEKARAACARGDLAQAADALELLRARLARDFGEGHDATQLVQLTLAGVERSRGRKERAAALEQLAPPAKSDPLPPALDSALSGLRACAAPGAAASAPAPISFEERMRAAQALSGLGRYREALPEAEAAHALAVKSGEPDARLRASEALVVLRLSLGDSRGALALAREADRLAVELEAVGARITFARLYAQAGALADAKRALDSIAKQAKSEADRAELGEAQGDLALRLGAPGPAIAALERAREAHAKVYGADDASTAAATALLGDAHRLAGDFPAALAAYREALRVRQAVFGAAHAETARTHNAIGALHADFRAWAEADAEFARAADALERALGAEHPETLTVRANRALAGWGAGRGAAAADAYAAAVAKLRAALGAEHPQVAEALRNLARIDAERGRAAQAERLLADALAVQRERLGPKHPSLAATLLARARIGATRGRLDEAAKDAADARALLEDAFGPDHPLVARAAALGARVAAARGDASGAQSLASAALASLHRHARRAFGALSDRQRALLVEDARESIGALLSARGKPDETYLALLPHRDSVLRSVAASRASARARDRRTREALAELESLRERYSALVLGASATPDELAALAAETDALEARTAGAADDAVLPDPAKTFARACKRLPEDAALVEIVAFDETPAGAFARPAPRYAAFALTGPDCTASRIDLGAAAAIDAAAERFAKAMQEQQSDAADARAKLSELVLAPLARALGERTRWLVVPDGSLWGIPLGALPDPAQPERYLLERVTVGYLTSAHDLASAEAKAARPGRRALLVGAPEFGSGGGRGPVVLTASGPCALAPFEPLPATAEELREVGELVGGGTSLVAAAATKRGLRDALDLKPELLHLATHAYFAGRSGCDPGNRVSGGWRGSEAPLAPNPLLLSGIALAGANQPGRIGEETQSGILTAYEVAALDLRSARLVVLSACETGAGVEERGQEVQGLRWGFRAAGARALLTSLWRSNDVATRRLMRAFYQALESNEIPADPFLGAEALRRAQLAHVADEARLGLRKPLVWANFVFSGVL